jgi:hypothetical protein
MRYTITSLPLHYPCNKISKLVLPGSMLGFRPDSRSEPQKLAQLGGTLLNVTTSFPHRSLQDPSSLPPLAPTLLLSCQPVIPPYNLL